MHAKKIDEHSEKVRVALQGGGQDRIDSQHEKGKLTARELPGCGKRYSANPSRLIIPSCMRAPPESIDSYNWASIL